MRYEKYYIRSENPVYRGFKRLGDSIVICQYDWGRCLAFHVRGVYECGLS